MIAGVPRRWLAVSMVFAFATFLLVFYREVIITGTGYHSYIGSKDGASENEFLQAQGEFWKQFRADLEEYGPKVDALTHPEGTKLDVLFNASQPRERPNFLKMTLAQKYDLSNAHAAFVEKIRSMQYQLPYRSNTRGIATTAGGPYLPVALVSIRMLREGGSFLPVEVFLADWSERDPIICSKVLPTLNAKCIVLQDIFDHDESMKGEGLEKYQYKIMAILFSSFEEVLFLDSDAFAIHRPNDLFDAEPFRSTGLVLWPDFWYPSESPLFFEIAGISAPELTDRASTESGEIMYSKRKHELSLLLAAYYNYYGPDYYFPLQSQGAPGEGDKETFVWSAEALGERYYMVNHPVKALGYLTKNGDWRGSAMAQFDPIQDNAATHAAELSDHISPRAYFAHVNFPKLDPAQIFDSLSFGAAGPTIDSDGKRRRIWHSGEAEAVALFGYDVERIVWKVVKETACDYEKLIISWKDKKDVCRKATDHWNEVFGG